MTLTSLFDLPTGSAHKAAPARIAADDHHFRALDTALEADLAALELRLDRALSHQTGDAQGRVEREANIDHLRRRRRHLAGFRRDAVLGRMTPADGTPPVYVGRLGISGADGRPLLVDWRSEVAAPFFTATRADPAGLRSRRRYRWSGGRVRDYWDENLDGGPLREDESPDEESALLASLGEARTGRMGSVLTTLAADQDAIIRAESRQPLVIDGGPGTGKTVVALHRAAYLLYHDPRLRRSDAGVLVVGPHHPYLHYVADVLPALGEDGVRTCTVADMVPEGADALPERDPDVARLKGSGQLVAAIGPAVALYEEPPAQTHVLDTEWWSVVLEREDWQEVFDAVDPGTPHNLARGELWEALTELVSAKLAMHLEEPPAAEQVRRAIDQDPTLQSLVARAWPLLEATDLVGDLFEVPAYLRRCAPSLSPEEVQRLQRERARAWTVSDLPLLDAARHRLGDPGADARDRRHRAARRERVEEIELGLEELIASDSSEMQELSMLRGADMRAALADTTPWDVPPPDALAGPFTHVVVDEAQELDDAQWAMILRRCPSRGLTIVGDRAQAARGFTGSWEERLARVAIEGAARATLTLNYRTPAEIMEHAAGEIHAAVPEATVPASIRRTGIPVRHGRVAQLEQVVREWLGAQREGTVAVIAEPDLATVLAELSRVQVLDPQLAKGLEFDLVVLVDPETFGRGIEGAVARYVASTRATQELVVLER
ncbi:RNA polymerase recycling motor ATPase HelR [Brachybacterium sp.]|uniref:RNA polymerase recycling motor ATPase HelR n=1 Tax=Brachybacterium sp. TaxID=1891286 RepID=UPI002ED665F4